MKTASKVAMISIAAVLATGAAAMAVAKHLHGGQGHAGHGHSADMMAAHAPVSTTSYAELKNTVAELDRAKQATEKYQDVRVAQAQAEGYGSSTGAASQSGRASKRVDPQGVFFGQ